MLYRYTAPAKNRPAIVGIMVLPAQDARFVIAPSRLIHSPQAAIAWKSARRPLTLRKEIAAKTSLVQGLCRTKLMTAPTQASPAAAGMICPAM